MRRPMLIVFSLLAALLAGLVAAQDGTPKAVVTEPVRDFETVARGEKLVHEFVIENQGTAALTLNEVRPACGCTVAEFDETIAPGASGKVRAVVDTTSFAGPIAKSVAVFTNDPANPKLQLVIKAMVKPYLEVSPGYARWNYVQGELIEPITQTLVSADDQRFEILEVKSPYDYVQVVQRDVSTPQQTRYELDVLLDPQAPVGALREFVEIMVDHPKQKVVQIPLSGFVRPRQHATPKSVEFGELERAHLPQRRIVTFTHFATQGVEVKDVESDITGVDGTISQEDERGHRFKLTLEVGPDAQPGPFSGEVRIHTTDPQLPVYRLPVSGTIL